MSLAMSASSYSGGHSAVSEAQRVLREIRDRSENALIEAHRLQEEARQLDKRTESLAKDVAMYSTQCIGLEQDVLRQENTLQALPNRFLSSTQTADGLLHSWSELDKQMERLSLTEKAVRNEQQARKIFFAEKSEEVKKEMNRFREWHALETNRYKSLLDEEVNKITALELRLNEAKARLDQSIAEKQKSELNQKDAFDFEFECIHQLSKAEADKEKQANEPISDSILDTLKSQLQNIEAANVQNAEAHLQKLESLKASIREGEMALEASTRALPMQSIQLQSLKEELDGRNKTFEEEIALAEGELDQVENEIKKANAANQTVLSKLDDEAAKFKIDWTRRIDLELTSLDEEEASLRAALKHVEERMETEKTTWEQKIADIAASRKNMEATVKQVRTAVSNDNQTVTDSMPKVKKQAKRDLNVGNGTTEPVSSSSSRHPAQQEPKSTVAKLFESAVNIFKGVPKKVDSPQDEVVERTPSVKTSFKVKGPRDYSKRVTSTASSSAKRATGRKDETQVTVKNPEWNMKPQSNGSQMSRPTAAVARPLTTSFRARTLTLADAFDADTPPPSSKGERNTASFKFVSNSPKESKSSSFKADVGRSKSKLLNNQEHRKLLTSGIKPSKRVKGADEEGTSSGSQFDLFG